MASAREWQQAFADAFAAPGTPVEQTVYATVLGDAHPAALDTYSCLTWDELHRIEQWLQLRDGDELVDLGCGRAGPGVWLASRGGAQLRGIDITDVPFAAATARAETAGVPATFTIGSLEATGLTDASFDAVVSVDALQFAQSPPRALTEAARVLRPGGHLALTAAEHVDDLAPAADRPAATAARAEAAGLVVAHCATAPDWPRTARRIAAAMVAASDDIAAATASDPVEVREALVRLTAHRRQERRVLLLAHRPH